MLTMAQYGMAALSLAVLGLLWVAGRTPERWASSALLIAMFATPLVDDFNIYGVRVGVASLAVGLFLALTILGLVANRWWLLAAAGVQLLSVGSWIIMLMGAETQIWAGVSFRMIVWMELMTLGALGLWEARRAPYAQLRGKP